MRFIQYLSEAYVGYIDGRNFGPHFKGGIAEIFINPTNKEIRDASKVSSGPWINKVRFIADFKNKDIYVFKADTLHRDVYNELKSQGKFKGSTLNVDMMWAVAKVMAGKLSYYDSDSLVRNAGVLEMDDKWTSKWFVKPLNRQFKELFL